MLNTSFEDKSYHDGGVNIFLGYLLLPNVK